jgi:hypothetical protein
MEISERIKAITSEWYTTPSNFFSPNMRSDFVEKQIRKALIDVRAQVIEECAAKAERLFLEATDTEWDEGVNTAKREIAKSIRALKGET